MQLYITLLKTYLDQYLSNFSIVIKMMKYNYEVVLDNCQNYDFVTVRHHYDFEVVTDKT